MLSKSDKRGILLITVSVVALAAMMVAVFMLKSKPKLGPDNCLANVTANTVIVLDHSERISEQTSKEIVARAMNHISTKVKVNERVTVFTISDLSKSSLIPLLSLSKKGFVNSSKSHWKRHWPYHPRMARSRPLRKL
jgi:flagellar basal body-associated protein FliL